MNLSVLCVRFSVTNLRPTLLCVFCATPHRLPSLRVAPLCFVVLSYSTLRCCLDSNLCFAWQCVHKICTKDRYGEWRRELEHATKKPYDQQWFILDTVHERCVLEYKIEQSLTDLSEDITGPLLRLIHGLPGSGKARTF